MSFHYLTRVRVDRLTAARQRLADNYQWHRRLWRALEQSGHHDRAFLFRVDERAQSIEAMVLSCERPVAPNWGTWETKQIAESFLGHSVYRFSLRANPTMKQVVRLEDGSRKKNGRRVAIINQDRLGSWFEGKTAFGGFSTKQLEIRPPIYRSFRRKGRMGKHVSVDFQGVLCVQNQDQFRKCFNQGIGSAKGFGFGLMLLQPLPE